MAVKTRRKISAAEQRASSALSRINWLKMQGCKFSFDVQSETDKLRKRAPDWKDEYAVKAAQSLDSVGGYVKTETNCDELLNEPLDNILNKAQELSGRRHGMLTESDPFAGLISKRPVRALAALRRSTEGDKFFKGNWEKFLYSENRKLDKPKFTALIAHRLSALPADAKAEIIYPISSWLKASPVLIKEFPDAFNILWKELIAGLAQNKKSAELSIIDENEKPDWAMKALNSPAGSLAETSNE